MRYILGVLALLEACDVTNNSRHLGFYQELEIRLKPREMIFFSFTWKITHKKALCMILVTRFTLIVERSWKNIYFPLKLSWPPLLMTSYLVTIATYHHQTCLKMNEQLLKTTGTDVLSSGKKLRKTVLAGGGIHLLPSPPPPLYVRGLNCH